MTALPSLASLLALASTSKPGLSCLVERIIKGASGHPSFHIIELQGAPMRALFLGSRRQTKIQILAWLVMALLSYPAANCAPSPDFCLLYPKIQGGEIMSMPEVKLEKLEFIGAGKHGEVYKLDDKRCIKIYKTWRYLRRELAALQRGASAPFFPRVYQVGRDYIIREYVPGIPLNRYLRSNPLTEAMARQMVEIVETMRRLRFRRADTRLSHIIIDPKGKLWVIDPVNTMKPSPPFPRKLLKSLMRRGMDGEFLEYVKQRYPEVYTRWEKHLASLASA